MVVTDPLTLAVIAVSGVGAAQPGPGTIALSPEPWPAYSYVALSVLVVIGSLAFLFSRWRRPGVFIALVGGVALLTAITPPLDASSRVALWTVGFGFLVAEMVVIYRDADKREKDIRADRAAAEARFDRTLTTFTEQRAAADTAFAAMMGEFDKQRIRHDAHFERVFDAFGKMQDSNRISEEARAQIISFDKKLGELVATERATLKKRTWEILLRIANAKGLYNWNKFNAERHEDPDLGPDPEWERALREQETAIAQEFGEHMQEDVEKLIADYMLIDPALVNDGLMAAMKNLRWPFKLAKIEAIEDVENRIALLPGRLDEYHD